MPRKGSGHLILSTKVVITEVPIGGVSLQLVRASVVDGVSRVSIGVRQTVYMGGVLFLAVVAVLPAIEVRVNTVFAVGNVVADTVVLRKRMPEVNMMTVTEVTLNVSEIIIVKWIISVVKRSMMVEQVIVSKSYMTSVVVVVTVDMSAGDTMSDRVDGGNLLVARKNAGVMIVGNSFMAVSCFPQAEMLIGGRHLIRVLVFVLIRVGVRVRRHDGRRQLRRRHRLRLVLAIVVQCVLVSMQSFVVGVTDVVVLLALTGVLSMKEMVQALSMNHRGNDADHDAQEN